MNTDLTAITLAKGSHDGDCDDPQRCLFEWYNWLTRQKHTDSCPPGVSPVLHAYGVQLNDALPDDKRQQLKRFLPNGADRLAGTASDGLDETRGYIALDWLIRTWTPAWLDLAGLTAEAAALRDLRRITDLVAAQQARPVVLAGRDKADAAWAAAWDAARAAAWDAAGAAAWAAAGAAAWAAAGDAAWDAAWAAAGDAAGDAAGAAAGDAAWAAARDAARDAAWAAAGDAARDAARAAARDAARDAAWAAAGAAAWAAARDAAWDAAWVAARDAARAAARDKLAPTVSHLQDSAITLFDAMIAPEAAPGE